MKDSTKFFDEMTKPAKLHPDLAIHLSTSRGMDVLKHPLVFGIPYVPFLNNHYNQCYEHKTKALQVALEKKNWNSYIFLHERPYRWNALTEIMYTMSDADYWETLGSIWSDTENLWQVQFMLPLFLDKRRLSRENIMKEDEKNFLHNLPDRIKIYRGHQVRNRMGYSWSLSYWRARWFAQRFQHKRQGVLQGFIDKKDVIGVFLGRNEFEIAVEPSLVQDLKPVAKFNRQSYMKTLTTDAVSRFKLSKTGSYHGPWHWDKVERNAIELCKNTKGADIKVCRLFAILHDAERLNEDQDPAHGKRAAKYIKTNLLKNSTVFDLTTVLSRSQIDKLINAIEDHNEGFTSDDPTIGVCWDSDRLDLSRVGIATDPTYLSTRKAKEMIWRV